MGNRLIHGIRLSKIASEMGLIWSGKDIVIKKIKPLSEIEANSLSFCNRANINSIIFDSVVVGPPKSNPGLGAVIEAKNPRLVFAKILCYLEKNKLFYLTSKAPDIDSTAIISSSAKIGFGVKIGPRTIISNNVVIENNVKIGADCIIKSNTVIGESGFGYERDENGVPIKILHLGNVLIGDRVEIGSLNTVCRATLGSTIIQDDVKTDDHVHIAHNCIVRRGALITACVELSGGVDVGEFSWIGPNSSVVQKISIGKNSFVGIGANVIRSVPDQKTVAGNPAKIIEKNK